MKMPTHFFMAALPFTLLLGGCQDNAKAKAEAEAAALAQLKSTMRLVAQDAADKNLIAHPACVNLTNEGRRYENGDADLLPEAAMWRFMERQGIAVRQVLPQQDGKIYTRFFVRETYRENYYPEEGKYCFGRWAIVDINPTPDGVTKTLYGVQMNPFDVKLRLTKIRSQDWLDSRLVRENLTGGLKSLTNDLEIRAYLPGAVSQLPIQDGQKTLNQ